MTTYEAATVTRSRTHTWEPRPEPTAELLEMTGRAVFEGDPGDHLLNPMGTVHGGFLATLLDSALGSAVMGRLPAGSAYTTVQLGVHLIRPVLPVAATLRCGGVALHVGRTTATAEARVTGTADGKPYAHGTTTCAVLRTG